jgi:hypothetical protein
MPQKRPVAVVVIAALQLVFGVPALGSYALSLAGLDKAVASLGPVNPQGQQRLTLLDVEQRLEEKVPSYGPAQRAVNVAGVVLSLLMIVSGIGLLTFRPWGRLAAIVYAVLSILTTAAFVVWYLAAVVPAVVEFGREIAATGGREAEAMELTIQAAYIGGPLIASLSAAYPVVVLLVLLRPSVRDAFRGEPLPEESGEPEDYRDAAPPGGLDEPDDRFRTGES